MLAPEFVHAGPCFNLKNVEHSLLDRYNFAEWCGMSGDRSLCVMTVVFMLPLSVCVMSS